MPTKDKLHNRCKKLYKDNKCYKCGQKETNTHPFVCKDQAKQTSKTIKSIIYREIKNKKAPEAEKNIEPTITKHLKIINPKIIEEITKGIIHRKLITVVKEFVNTTEINQCISNIYKAITKYTIRIWQNRCEDFQRWEKSQGISNKTKKKAKYNNGKKQTDEIKDRYPEIINKFMENHIKRSHNIYQALAVDINIGRTLVN